MGPSWFVRSWAKYAAVAVAVLVGLGAVGFALALVVTDGLRGSPSADSLYAKGITTSAADLIRTNVCDEAWREIQDYPGGFDAALSQSVRLLPGPLEDIHRQRGDATRVSFFVQTTNGGRYIYHVPVDSTGDNRVLCPEGPDRLLGELIETVSPAD